MSDQPVHVKKGLEGVIFDSTAISKATPEKRELIYRGYAVPDLAEQCSFEETAYLLLRGELPPPEKLAAFCQRERRSRCLGKALRAGMRQFPRASHPMDAVRTAVSFLGMEEEFMGPDHGEEGFDKAVKLLAKIPTIIAADYRIRNDLEIIPPRDDLSIAENFYHMCFDKAPEKEFAKALDASLTLYAEHGFNVSTFTARVIVSSLSDMCAAVTGAIGSLKGPLHGGANEAVMHMLKEIGSPDRAHDWLRERLQAKRKIMGFGHRLYRIGDSRVPTMTRYRNALAERTGELRWVEISIVLEETMISEKNIYPNLDFPAGPTYHMLGFPIDMFTPIFVMARVAGWTAHVMEQLSDNRLVRPLGDYVGPAERPVVPLAERE